MIEYFIKKSILFKKNKNEVKSKEVKKETSKERKKKKGEKEEMSKDKSEKYQKKRESAETSRVGMKWDHDEDERLLSAAKLKMSLDEIARSHCREVGGIATRLYHHAVKMIDEKNNISKVAEMLNLSVEDIQKHIATKEKRREYMQNKSKTNGNDEKDEKDDKDDKDEKKEKKEKNNDMKGDNIISLLTEIRDLLAIIAKK